MVRSNTNALGIIFPNIYDKLVSELTNERLMASIPFGSRYRMIDFLLSSMVNCGIDNISVLDIIKMHSRLRVLHFQFINPVTFLCYVAGYCVRKGP